MSKKNDRYLALQRRNRRSPDRLRQQSRRDRRARRGCGASNAGQRAATGPPCPRPTAFLSLFFFLFFTLPASEALPTTAAHRGNGAQWRQRCQRCPSRQAPKSEKARPSSSSNPVNRIVGLVERNDAHSLRRRHGRRCLAVVVHCCEDQGAVGGAVVVAGRWRQWEGTEHGRSRQPAT